MTSAVAHGSERSRVSADYGYGTMVSWQYGKHALTCPEHQELGFACDLVGLVLAGTWVVHRRDFAQTSPPAGGVIRELSLGESKVLFGFHSVSSQGRKGAKARSWRKNIIDS